MHHAHQAAACVDQSEDDDRVGGTLVCGDKRAARLVALGGEFKRKRVVLVEKVGADT